QKSYLSMLKKGTCILRVNSIETPFVLEIPLVKRKWISRELIELNNQAIMHQFNFSKRKSGKKILLNNSEHEFLENHPQVNQVIPILSPHVQENNKKDVEIDKLENFFNQMTKEH
ncbi:MAG: hypothetical protein ACTSU4_09215, partial [Promethearchaeota archaeon]